MKVKLTKLVEKEVVYCERKGRGHPDTIADCLAEYLSIIYSKHFLNEVGYIPNHSFDRVFLQGGLTDVTFGGGQVISPIKALISGRVTKFSGLEMFILDGIRNFFKEHIPTLNVSTNTEINFDFITFNSPSYVRKITQNKYLSEFSSIFSGNTQAIKVLTRKSNDMVIAAAHWPLSLIENLVISLEKYLNSNDIHKKYRWLGYDIKIIGIEENEEISLIVVVPQISKYVSSLDEYKEHIAIVKELITRYVESYLHNKAANKHCHLILTLNPRDNYKKLELYMTLLGTSLERGDKGIVGRGNRFYGLISPAYSNTIEGFFGKKPYSAGKIYNLACLEISRCIYEKYHLQNECIIISHHWHDVSKPYKVIIKLQKNGGSHFEGEVESLVKEVLDKYKDPVYTLSKSESLYMDLWRY